MLLEGSCHCQAVRFSLTTHAPYPYARCHCSICRKTAGSGGFGIFIVGDAESLQLTGREHVSEYRATMDDGTPSHATRSFCKHCGSQLWLFDPRWPEHLHPFASAFDTPLPKPPVSMDYHLTSAAPWVLMPEGESIERLDGGYAVGMEDWHRQHGLWVE